MKNLFKILIFIFIAIGIGLLDELKANINEKIEEVVYEKGDDMELEEKYFYKDVQIDTDKTNIEVYKNDRKLKLFKGDELVGVFKIALGSNSIGHKQKEGDRKTPEGKYYICTRNDRSKYTLFLGLSYPNEIDAKNAYDKGLISKEKYDQIVIANQNKGAPNWNTELGGEVGIHGGGTDSDWTFGCIALSNEDIKNIWQHTKIGTEVVVYE